MVSWWSDDDGWGVIESSATPGGCWVHFSVVTSEDNGFRHLQVGQAVAFAWEKADQDGFHFRATRVEGSKAVDSGERPSTLGAPSGYESVLTIVPDDSEEP